MLVVPITGKISWKNPPVVTILLIAMNCLVFFAFQLNDHAKHLLAHEHYYRSGLADLEVNAYIEYKTSEKIPIDQMPNHFGDQAISRYYQAMAADSEFQKKLDAGLIITPDNPIFETWKALKAKNTKLLEAVTSYRYGFRPSHASITTAFTYMFLHGGFAPSAR